MADDTVLKLTVDIVSAHLSNNAVAAAELPALIHNVYGALVGMSSPPPKEVPKQTPAVAIRNSIKPDYLVCLEDGKQVKMLKRYLATHFGLTPANYRAKWKLPMDYPMVAPNYAERRRELAHKIGLGRKAIPKSIADAPIVDPPASDVAKPARRKLGIARMNPDATTPAMETTPAVGEPKGRARRKPRVGTTPV